MGNGFLEGCTIGLLYAAPIGPIAVLCLRRTLSESWFSGVVSGLGCATATALYSIIVVLSVNSFADVLSGYHNWLRMLGGVFLCYLGIKIALTQPSKPTNVSVRRHYGRCYISTFILAFVMALPDLTIPVFVLNWISSVSAVGFYNPLSFSLGVLTSEILWWLIFCSVCWKLRRYLKVKFLQWINYASGGAIASYGITTVARTMLLA